MRRMAFSQAIDDAVAQAMAHDPTVILLGEDLHGLRTELLVRFGRNRVLSAPISEAAFVGAAVAAAMAGLRPIVEVYMVDFLGPAMDALLNHAAKLETFSGGRWTAPVVVRAACGAGTGDGGQHQQSLWGWLAHIPGLAVAVPSTPADAGALMLAAVQADGPVVFLEHRLLSELWREVLAGEGREGLRLDVPSEGAVGPVPSTWQPLPLGQAAVRREGSDLTMVSLGVGVHRCLEAAAQLESQGISAGVVDLRCAAPLDREMVCREAARTGRLLVVDEDYRGFGLSGEVAALALEAGHAIRLARVCTEQSIPYARPREEEVLPNVGRVAAAAAQLMRA